MKTVLVRDQDARDGRAIQWDGDFQSARTFLPTAELYNAGDVLGVRTRFGSTLIGPGDWIVVDDDGDVLALSKAVFDSSYDVIEDQTP